jgi:hypothetical protein
MVAIIREADREPVSAVSKRHGVREQTIYLHHLDLKIALGN